MKSTPMLFSGTMIRALLDGSKTQTRRIVKPQPLLLGGEVAATPSSKLPCPFGVPGDQIWCKETFAAPWGDDYKFPDGSSGILYRANNPTNFPDDGSWKPSIHMPRKLSRITLEIVNVRVERLNDITDNDAIAEGIKPSTRGFIGVGHAKACYADLWDSINKKKAPWAKNPWVWVISFKTLPLKADLFTKEKV